jgi:hypothetical protein
MFTIGADPEFFIQKYDGTMQPIVGLLGGTKDKPIAVQGARKGFAVQEDNVMAEYNIPPTAHADQFAEFINLGRVYALNMIRTREPNVDVFYDCAAEFTQPQLATPQAQTFGCSPDFDAYAQGAPLPRISPAALTTPEGGAWRFAGGHIHLGYRDSLGWQVPDFVVATLCDLLISIPMIAHGFDPQGMRRQFYGTPGRYRPTAYGIEYRTLGNKWTLSQKFSQWAAFSAFKVMDLLNRGEGEVRRVYNDMPWQDVGAAIANEDAAEASALRQFVRNYGLETI